MSLIKLQVQMLIFQLIVRTCIAGIIIETPTTENSTDLIKAVVTVVKFCHESSTNVIGVSGNSPDTVIVSLSSEEHFSVILIDNARRSVRSGSVSKMAEQKLQIFVVTASSPTELLATLGDIKNSPSWNHMGYFYIIHWPLEENGCSKAFEFLWTAWTMNLLEATFMCTHETRGPLIYGFNPFTSDAPNPWTLEKIYSGKNNHPWSLVVQLYSEHRQICKNLHFDKTNDLGGYEIRCSVKPFFSLILIDTNKTGIHSLGGESGAIVRSIFWSLNATAKLVIHRAEESAGFVNNEGVSSGILADTTNGISDISLIPRGYLAHGNIPNTYPHFFTGAFIITQYSGEQSQLNKIISLIDRTSRIGVCVVCLVTFIFLKYVVYQTPMIAFLNTLRVFCNSCLTKLPIYPASRIYLAGLFFFVVTVQGIYQGQLASLLAKRVPTSNINTLEDLIESDHIIYGYERYSIFFTHNAFKERFVAIKDYDCTKYVLRDSSAACVLPSESAVLDAARFKLYLSKDPIFTTSVSWTIRKDWPLERRFNTIIQRLVDANIFQYSSRRDLDKALRTIAVNRNEDADLSCKILGLGDLGFAFAILGIGLGLATISFIVETIVSRRGARSKIANTRQRLPNLAR